MDMKLEDKNCIIESLRTPLRTFLENSWLSGLERKMTFMRH